MNMMDQLLALKRMIGVRLFVANLCNTASKRATYAFDPQRAIDWMIYKQNWMRETRDDRARIDGDSIAS